MSAGARQKSALWGRPEALPYSCQRFVEFS